MTVRPCLLVALAVVALVGCSNAGSTGTGGSGGSGGASGGDFDVTVGTGLTPTMTWPGAGALGLAVAEFPGTSVRTWVLAGLGTTGFASGVT